MDCDTTGVEPDFSLVKSKKLVGGGEITIVNRTVPLGLEKLGYAPSEVSEVVAFIDAVNSKDQAKIASAKKEMQQEADKSDEAVRNSTGPAANAVNAALNNIRLSVMSNDVKTLERAKQLLEDASK